MPVTIGRVFEKYPQILPIINNWSFGIHFADVSSAALANDFFAFSTPGSSNKFVSPKQILCLILEKVPTLLVHEQYLLMCYLGVPTPLLSMLSSPANSMSVSLKPCPGFLIINFDRTFVIKNFSREYSLEDYKQLNANIVIDSITVNIKKNIFFTVGEQENNTLIDLLQQGYQVIILTTNSDVELVLAYLMQESLFGAIAKTDSSLLQNIQLVVTTLSQSCHHVTKNIAELVGYAAACLNPAIFTQGYEVFPISWYGDNDRTTHVTIKDLPTFLNLPATRNCRVTFFRIEPEREELIVKDIEVANIKPAASDNWRPQNYPIPIGSIAAVKCLNPTCKSSVIFSTAMLNNFCPTCGCRYQVPVKKFYHLSNSLLGQYNFNQAPQELALVNESATALQKIARGFLARSKIEIEAKELLQKITATFPVASNNEKEYHVKSSAQLQRIKWYLFHAIYREKPQDFFIYGLTPEMLSNNLIGLKYCGERYCVYPDKPKIRFCQEHGHPLIRLSVDSLFLQRAQASSTFQSIIRGYLARNRFKKLVAERKQMLEQSQQWFALARDKLQNIMLNPSSPFLEEDVELTLDALLEYAYPKEIALPYEYCLNVIDLVIIKLFGERAEYAQQVQMAKIHALPEVNFEIAFCKNPACLKILHNAVPFLSPISQNQYCVCGTPLLILKAQSLNVGMLWTYSHPPSQVSKENFFTSPPPSAPSSPPASLRTPERMLAQRATPPTSGKRLTRLAYTQERAQKVEKNLALAFIQERKVVTKAKVRSQRASATPSRRDSFSAGLSVPVTFSKREAICKYQLLNYFRWCHSCDLGELATITPISAIVGKVTTELAQPLDLASYNISIKRYDDDYHKLLLLDDEATVNASNQEAYFGAPWLPSSLTLIESQTELEIKLINLWIIEFESLLKCPRLIPATTMGNMADSPSLDNIKPNIIQALTSRTRSCLLDQIAIICNTWDLEWVQQYLRVIFPTHWDKIMIIINPNSAVDSESSMPRSTSVLRQIQYLWQAVWDNDKQIRNICLIHSDSMVLEAFNKEFVMRRADLSPKIDTDGIYLTKQHTYLIPNETMWSFKRYGVEKNVAMEYYSSSLLISGWNVIKFVKKS